MKPFTFIFFIFLHSLYCQSNEDSRKVITHIETLADSKSASERADAAFTLKEALTLLASSPKSLTRGTEILAMLLRDPNTEVRTEATRTAAILVAYARDPKFPVPINLSIDSAKELERALAIVEKAGPKELTRSAKSIKKSLHQLLKKVPVQP